MKLKHEHKHDFIILENLGSSLFGLVKFKPNLGFKVLIIFLFHEIKKFEVLGLITYLMKFQSSKHVSNFLKIE